jgi:hypothetical protein
LLHQNGCKTNRFNYPAVVEKAFIGGKDDGIIEQVFKIYIVSASSVQVLYKATWSVAEVLR